MALPKRRHSKTRRNKRRTHWKLGAPSMSSCAQCGSKKLPHRVCPTCGHYGGVRVLEVDNG
jgi:large subunit ribosomal protein L32